MFYEVRIKDAKGNVKKTVSGKELSRKFWKSMEKESPEGKSISLGKKKPKENTE